MFGKMVKYVNTEKTVAEIKANENSFATFMAAMILKYGPKVVKELEVKQNRSVS